MTNFTFKRLNLIKPLLIVALFLFSSHTVFSQFYTKHYVAPAPWQYFSKANEIIIATNSTTTVNIALKKSDGTLITNLTAIKGTPAVYRFSGLPSALGVHPFNTIVNAAGLIITSDGPTSVNLRNVASDNLGSDGTDANIKGNASLTSFGDAGIGVRYRIGYYRDGSLAGTEKPTYSIMAINNGTTIKLNGVVLTTLNAGESYLFQAAIGSLVESSSGTVMNTSARLDAPGGCGDGAFDQIPPESVLGAEYFIERGKGNDTAEQTTVVAIKANTVLTINTFSTTGTLTGTVTTTLVNAGDFYTFKNGVSNTPFTATRVSSTENVAVYSGTAQSCEVDISVIAPVSACGGSNFIETKKFRAYNSATSLPYFGYVLLKDATAVVDVNGVNIETLAGARYQLGTTGWYLINFTDTQISSPDIISVSSSAKLTVSIVQQGGGFSMAGFFSNFAQQPDDPTLTYISGGGCTNNSAILSTPSGFAPYQWYYNGVAISGETSNTYTATQTGSYSVASTLVCGSLIQSRPIIVTLCTDLEVLKTVDVANPCVGSNVEFTVKVTNLGPNNASGLSVNDLLPSGYTYISSVPSVGTYNSTTGIWSIGNLNNAQVITLKVLCKVNASGVYLNTAAIPAGSQPDSNTSNNSASVSTTPVALPTVLSLTGSTICVSPGSNGTITSTTSVSGITYQLYNSGNVAVQSAKAGTGSGLTWSSLPAGNGYYVVATNAALCTATSGTVNVSTTPNPTALSLTGSTICVSPGSNGTITSTTSVSGVTYQLYNSGNVAVQSAKAGTGSGLTWSSLPAGNGYYVVATNAALCTATSGTVNVSTTPNPTALSLTGSTICVSPGSNGTITSTTSVSGVTYQLYNSGNVAVQSAKAGTGSGLTWSSLPAGNGYYVVATNAALCTATSGTVNVSTTPNPTALSLTGSTICVSPGSNGTIISTTSVSGVTYQLYNLGNVSVQSAIAGTGSGLTWSSLPAGNGYYVVATNAALCTATSGTVNVSTTPNPTALSLTGSTICVSPGSNGTITSTTSVSGVIYQLYNSGNVAVQSAIAGTGSGLTWSSLPAGNGYYVVATNAALCTATSGTVNVSTTPNPTALSLTGSTICVSPGSNGTITSTTSVSGVTYQLYNSGNVSVQSAIAGTGSGLTWSSLPAGNGYYVVATNAALCTATSGTVNVSTTPNPTTASAGADQIGVTTCGLTAVVLDANTPTVGTGKWTIVSGTGGSFVLDTNPTTTFSGIAGTAYVLRWTISNAPCTDSADDVNVTFNLFPAVPTIASVAPTCAAAGTSTISNYIGTNTYTFSPAGPTVDATGLVSSMVFGTSYTVTSNNGSCTSGASASFSNLDKLVTPAVPTIASVAPTCTAAGTSSISNYIGTNTYTFSPAGPTVDGTGLVSSMVFGTSYTVTSNNASCTSGASASFSNLDKLVTPAVPTIASVAPTCAAAGTSSISNYIGTNTYTFSPAGPTVDATGLVSSMVFGTSYTVTSNNGSCTSGASASFSNLDKLVTPAVPTIASVAPTCAAAGTSSISNYIGTNTYTFSPAGPTVDATGLVSSMVFGTSYTVTSNNGSCTSGASASFSNLDKLVTPAVPTIASVAPTCAAAGTSSISNYIGTNTYTFSPAGPTVDATGLVSSMVFGTSYTVTSNNGSCTSGASASFSNLDKLVTPAVPTIASVAPTCAAAGTSSISNYIGTNTYTFSPAGPTVDATGLVSSMVFGTSYTVTSNNGSCTSGASASFSNLDKLVTPAVPTIASVAPTCAAAGTSSISNYIGTNTYTFSPAGPTVDATGLVSSMVFGTSYTVTSNNGSCTSGASASFSNLDKLVTPAVPTIASVAPTCAAAGTSSISNYIGTNTYTFSPAGPTVDATGLVSSMVFGTSYTVTSNNGSCTSGASASFSNLDKLVTPAVPTIASVAPTCAAAGTSSISNYIGTNTYTFSPAGPTVDATGLVSSMVFGTSYTVTSNNGSCTSGASASFSNLDKLVTPAVPTIASVAPTCAAAGTSSISNYIGTNTYTFSPAGPTVDATGLVSSMVFGTSYTVTSNNGSCTSGASASFSNLDKLVTPAVPTISSSSSVCSGSDAIFTITGTAGNIVTYSGAASGTATIGVAGTVDITITGITTATTLNLTTVSNGSCTRPLSATTTVAIILRPDAGTDGTLTICSGSTVTAGQLFAQLGGTPTAGGIWTPALAGAGTYTYTVAATTPCTVDATASVVVSAQAQPSAGTLSGIQAVCVGGNTTFSSTVTGGIWTSGDLSKATVDSLTGVITGLTAGTVTITYTVAGTGVCSDVTATRDVSVIALPVVPAITGGSINVCAGSGTVTFLNAMAGGTWSVTNGTGTASITIGGVLTGQTAGTVTVEYTMTNIIGCAVKQAFNLTINAAPNAGTLSGTQAICVSGSTTFSSTVAGGSWSSSNASIATVDPVTGLITGISSGTATITYKVVGTGGCPDATVTRTVSVYSPTVSLSGSTNVLENSIGTVDLTASLSTISYEDVTVNLSFTGTASGLDYNASGISIVIPAGSLSGTVSIDPIDDSISEGNESVIANITSVVGGCAVENGIQTATVTILDNEATPTVSISNPTVTEGANAVFTVSIDVASSVDTVVDVVTATGTAGTSDYTATTTTVTIPAGQTSVTVSVPTTDDIIDEPSESFTLNATVTSGNTSNTSVAGTATITDNDATPTVSISNPTVTEGVNAVFTVSIDVASSVDTVVDVVTATGTAGTSDYTATTTTVTIPAGQTSVTVNVPTTDDATDEPAENFTLNGTVTSGNTSNTTPFGTATINDNDATPMVSISSPSVIEGANALFTVSIDVASSVDTVVDVVTATGTAGTSDYTATTTTVTIPAGQTSVTVSVPTTDDIIDEPSESFTLNATVTSGNTSNTSVAGTATITDNEATPTVSISSPTVTEGANAVFTVSIDVASSVDTVIDIVTNTGTAGTSDYTATTTTVTIPAGQTSVTVSVPTTDDIIDEPSESFTLNATVTSGNTSNTSVAGTATITDNDATPTVSISNPTVTEGANAVFTVSIDVASSVDTVVDVVTATGTAGTSDYTATTTTVTIPAGQTSVTVSVPTTDDIIDEPSESFTLNATVTSGNTSNTSVAGTATITDNEATPTVSISNPTVTEGANAVFTVSIDVASSVDTVVDVVTATGTAGTSDYTATTTTVTIPAGQTSVTVSVPTTDDIIDEPSESFTLNATVTSGNTSNTSVAGTATITDNDIPAPAPPAVFAVDDLSGPITSSNGVQNILNVLDNDFVDLNKATLSNVTLSTVAADSTGFMKLKLDGTIELAANTPAGTYSLTYSICDINNTNNCASAKVTLTVICNLSTAISGVVYNAGTNTPLANVPVTLKPINNATGPVLLSLTKLDGSYAFTGMIPGDYVLQVQDANLNAAQELFNTTPSFLILKVEDCNYQKIDFGYDKTDLLVLGDFVWYDINNNGIQDEWYDANNDGLVTKNLPDANGVVDYSKWEWIDFNGDGSYKGKENTGELNAAGFGNGTTNVPNIFVTGPNGFSRSVTMGVEGYWRTRAPKDAYGEYKIEFIKEANFEMASEAMSASGLVKVLPSLTLKQSSTNKSKSYVDCGLTTNNILYAQFSATEKVHLDLDFGISCKTYADILANNDDAGIIDGLKASNGIFNAIANDTFNGVPINPSDVILTFTPSPNFTMGTNGLLNTLSNIPGGTYTLTYSICEKANPNNCSTASVNVFVARPSIALVKTAHFNDENADGYAQAGETISYSFEVTNTGNVPLTNVTILDPLPGVVMTGTPLTLAIGETNATHFQGVYAIKQTDINKGSISNQATVFGTSPNNRVVEDKSDDINVVNDNPTVLTVSGCAIKVYNAVTPDGSDKYDKLYIQGIECYTDNSIEIFNRWGVLVFEREHYNNDDVVFRGISEGRVTVEKSQELPAGTYFYILKYKDSESNAFEKTGYLYLNRK
ncbi:Calx-beta domain-containing protein [Flavobacterium sp. M31R6]|uniref:Calx-beta domain-containing protein n=1 Tax=Flavobacterium sp. M31R6 TaxID=2739062 RepID=UPI001568B766|nr:Calx-beta domain-containing protein [Flavobacterium sp. M31R6]QKJ62456.1 gliding motility-associated C-terminal domain-containing protein [Flavobacterium sp. M31R6]